MLSPILRAPFGLLPDAFRADTSPVAKIVAVVICGLTAVSAAGASTSQSGGELLRRASHLSGLRVRHVVREQQVTGPRYDALVLRAVNRDYPSSLRAVDTALYTRLGLIPHSVRSQLAPPAAASRAWYDATARKLLLRRTPTPQRIRIVHELVRALVDQNFNLRRLTGLRARDRDRSLAAKGIVDGTAALASGVRADPLRGTPLARFLQLEASAGLGPGKALAWQLRYLGGARALATALRTFPQTTEQLLHIDKFLERERALPIRLAADVGDMTLSASETFGELDVRSLLRAFGVPNAGAIAAGWGGGRLALYVSPQGETVAALALRWDSTEDADEWRDAVPRYLDAAFPGSAARDCPPLDRCWTGSDDVASGVLGTTSIFAMGPGSDRVAAALFRQG
jgi:hypothetical protein